MNCSIKYAPTNLLDVIYPNHAVQTRIDAYAHGLLENHIILYGPNGTGKSTIARLLPDAIEGCTAQVEDGDFDDLLSNKNLINQLKQFCHLNTLTNQSKVYFVFEEFDNAKVNLNKLWTAMDACAGQLQFIITTNNLMKVHESIRSRCDLIHIHKLSAQVVLPRAQYILKSEGILLPDTYVLAFLQEMDWSGDLRSYMKLLDGLIANQKMGLPLPAVKAASSTNQSSFKLVSGGNPNS